MSKNEKLLEKESIQFHEDLIAQKNYLMEKLNERIEFLESVIEKQKNIMYHYDRALGKGRKIKR